MFLSCGDTLFDLFVDDTHPAAVSSTAGIALVGAVGGSPLNVGIGLARLGHTSRYFTSLSSDIFGQRLRRHITANNVDLSLCTGTGLNTTLAIIQTDVSGAANYVFYTANTADTSIEPKHLPAQLPADVRVVHFGSYSTAVQPSGDTLAAFARREASQRIISYDPNIRLTIEPDLDRWRDTFKRFADAAHVIKASDEDVAALFGPYGEERFVRAAFDAGAELVFVTEGRVGARGYNREGDRVTRSALSIEVVDTVGAGDTFQTTLLHWLAEHGHVRAGNRLTGRVDLDACVALALRAAAITCTRHGANLPTREELLAGTLQ